MVHNIQHKLMQYHWLAPAWVDGHLGPTGSSLSTGILDRYRDHYWKNYAFLKPELWMGGIWRTAQKQEQVGSHR